MKINFLLFTTALWMSSCSNPEKVVEIKPEPNPVVIDTANKFPFSKIEDENLAYSQIRFGISQEEYKNVNQSDTVTIGKKDKYLLKPFFNTHNELFKIHLIALDTFEYFNTDKEIGCIKQMSRFYDFLKPKYGETPLLKNFTTEYIDDSWAYQWNVGAKKIELGARTAKKCYRTLCSISNAQAEINYLNDIDTQTQERVKRINDSLKKANPI